MKWIGLVLVFSFTARLYADTASFPQTIARDLEELAALEFDQPTPAHEALFGRDFSGRSLKKYFLDRVARVKIVKKLHFREATGEFRDGTMFIRDDFFKLSRQARWGVLLHEAAHADWPTHDICPHPLAFNFQGKRYAFDRYGKKNQRACDASEKGAYGTDFAFTTALVFYCRNCADDVRQDALVSMILNALIRITDPAAVDRLVAGYVPEAKGGADFIRKTLEVLAR